MNYYLSGGELKWKMKILCLFLVLFLVLVLEVQLKSLLRTQKLTIFAKKMSPTDIIKEEREFKEEYQKYENFHKNKS